MDTIKLKSPRKSPVNKARRSAAIAIAGSPLWIKPVINSVVIPAHAQTTEAVIGDVAVTTPAVTTRCPPSPAEFVYEFPCDFPESFGIFITATDCGYSFSPAPIGSPAQVYMLKGTLIFDDGLGYGLDVFPAPRIVVGSQGVLTNVVFTNCPDLSPLSTVTFVGGTSGSYAWSYPDHLSPPESPLVTSTLISGVVTPVRVSFTVTEDFRFKLTVRVLPV